MGSLSTASQPTHYQVLQVPQSDTLIDPSVLKAAYHKALLAYHPDKRSAALLQRWPCQSDSVDPTYTVDQINEAYQTLSNRVKKADYDQRLQHCVGVQTSKTKSKLHSGVETYDLEDLSYDDRSRVWARECRCGDESAYRLTEGDLEKESDQGEIQVACKGCSLSIRVLFDTT